MKNITLFFVLFTGLCGFTIRPADTPVPEWLKPGSELIYSVGYNGSEYRMTVRLKQVSPMFKFTFSIDDPHRTRGNVNISREALDSCTKLVSAFISGQTELMDQTVLVMSKKLFNIITPEQDMPVDIDGYLVKIIRKSTNSQFYSSVKSNRTAMDAVDFISDDNENGSGTAITVLNNAGFPLVLKMDAKWHLKLTEIK